MSRLFLQLHLYAGLVCSAYLLVYGVSSLAFNHGWGVGPAAREARQWTAMVAVPAADAPQAMAEDIRDRLGLMGGVPPWEVRGDGSTSLRFSVDHPGKSYQVQWQRSQEAAQVSETRKGGWSILRAMHGLAYAVPGSRFLHAWSWYTEITTWLVVLLSLSGVYLWAARRIELYVGGILLATFAVLTLAMMLFAVLHG